MALETVFLRPRFINFMRTLWKTEIKDIYILTWSNNPLLFNVIKMTSVHFWLGWWGRCFICLCSVLQVGQEATVMIESETSETTTERHCYLSPLSCEHTFPFSHKSHCKCNLQLTLPSTHVWCWCKCCFCKAYSAVASEISGELCFGPMLCRKTDWPVLYVHNFASC